MAARAVKSWAGSWVTYQKHLNQHLSEALDDAHDRSQHYPRGVLAALDLSLDRFSPPGSPERALLVGAASFAPDMVPYIWVGEVGKICAGEIKSMRALATAEGLGLLEVDRDAQTLMMHRLVHRRVRERFVEHQWRMLPCVESWLTKMVGRERAQTEEIDARRAHVEEALKVAEQEEGFELPWIRIAEGLARHLRYRGRYDESLSLFTRAVEKARSRSDLFAEKFRCLSGLALTLQAIGRAEEAAPLLEEALNLLQTAYAPEHPDIAVGLATLARVLPDVGDVGRARSLLEEALAIAEKIRGPDHPDVAKLLSNLAGLLLYTGDVDRALPQLRRALATLERTQGPDEPDVTTIRSTLAMALRDAGRADEALPLAERVLAVDERTYGPFHPEVARSLSKLAGVLRDLKRPGEARPLLERALEIDERTHGPRHANVVKDLERLLGVLRDLEDEGSAKPLLDRLRDLDQGLSSGMPTGEHTRVTAVTVSVSELPCAPRR
jgi:tetratricopeptide (TPR) repeat protein